VFSELRSINETTSRGVYISASVWLLTVDSLIYGTIMECTLLYDRVLGICSYFLNQI
jgi:hypothetical protein